MQSIISTIFCNKLSKSLFLLYLLNFSDWICTLLLLNTGKFQEVNPFMLPFMDSSFTSFIIKGILPLGLVLFINYRANNATAKQMKIANRVVGVGIGIYTLINMLHILNFVYFYVVY